MCSKNIAVDQVRISNSQRVRVQFSLIWSALVFCPITTEEASPRLPFTAPALFLPTDASQAVVIGYVEE